MVESEDMVYDDYRRRVFSLAFYTLASREEAEEVTQDVLVRFWRRGREIEPQGRLPWILRVTRNACIDLLRHRRVGGEKVPLETEEGGERLRAPQADPEAVTRNKGLRRELRTALAELDEPYRSAVILREVQGLSYQEISAALGQPLNTVKVHIHRGRRRLRERLREVYADVTA
ncbi:MAG: sigma-70 family RNA polymerase sigma factor [Acidobacteriota bacterium]